MTAVRTAVAVGLCTLLLPGCATRDAAPDAALAAPNVVEVVATDFAYQMPDTIPAGPTRFRLVNQGPDFHHIQLVKLEEGRTMADFAALDPHGPAPSWAVLVGGPNTPLPGGGISEGILDLAPGTYVAICVIPASDGVPHIAKGMVHPLTVVPAVSAATMPEADVTMTLLDYSFELSGPLSAGHRVLRVVNAADQPHEVVIFRLEPGKSAQDIMTWFEGGMQGPPPAAPVGGTVGLAKGHVNLVPLELTAGDYGLLCFFPDVRDGRTHIAHGMISQVTVQ
jgi:hypothetical protein